MEPLTIFGLLAGVAGIADLIGIYARRDRLPDRMIHLRTFGAFLMLMVSVVVLTGLVKLG